MGQADCKLGQPLPQLAFAVRSRLPGSLQDLVGVERASVVEQPLSFNQTFVR
jgi:hypothetical protein